MSLARTLGVSLKRFNGWEPSRVTTVERDDDGRIVRTVTVTEPEWDDEERGWMQALDELDGQTCSGCGGWLPETTSLEADGKYHADHPFRCHRCDALEIRRTSVRDKPNAAAFTVWPVTRR